MKITKESYYHYGGPDEIEVVVTTHNSGIVNTSEKVTDHLLFAILEKLEEVRCGLIDVEEAVNKLNPAFYLTRKIGG